MDKYIVELNESCRNDRIGNKARNLIFLMKNQINVPKSWACDWAAQEFFLLDENKVRQQLYSELERLINPDKKYAVRSSASTEDGEQFSFAGQFKSYLNVQSIPSIVQTIFEVWSSTNSPTLIKYMKIGRASCWERV